jgi:hypothetical protein
MQVVALRPETSAPAIQSSLARVRARQVALVFPLGRRPQLAEANALRALADYCEQERKRVTLIGGDEALRALAVAAGFAVATSLEDALAHEEKDETARRKSPPDREAWEQAYARFYAREPRTTLPLPLEGAPALDEPPDYVRRLLEEDGAYAVPRDGSAPGVQHGGRITRKLAAIAEADASRTAYETREDAMTMAIRGTGGLSRQTTRPLALLPSAEEPPADTGSL